ncbi:MAG: nucleotidyltransferase [Actinomycetota bacterium]
MSARRLLDLRPGGPAEQRRAVSFEGQDVEEDTFLDVLDEAVAALESSSVPYAALGGLGSAMYGRQRWTHDADFFVRDRHDAAIALEHLHEAGFATQQTDENWLYKGIKRGVLVDVLFKAKGDIYYDEEMIARTQRRDFKGRTLPVIPPEDLIVIKAIIHDEATPRHWYDSLAVIAGAEIDWDYLLSRSMLGPRRILSLLIYAQSNDLIVPDRVVRELFTAIYDV